MSVTHSLFVPASQRTAQHGLGLQKPEPEPIKLDEKHRPKTFAEMVGQSYAVNALQDFADSPFSQAFIFSGSTGTGKSTAAKCLARALAVDMNWDFLHVESAKMDDEAVQTAVKILRRYGVRDGYKFILCDEVHLATPKAKGLFLSILENLPHKSIVVFTTHQIEKLETAFIDRCEHIEFESNGRVLRPDGQAYLNRLWVAEGLKGNPPNVEDAKGVVINNVISFRRIARFVESEQRKQSAQQMPDSIPVCNDAKRKVRL